MDHFLFKVLSCKFFARISANNEVFILNYIYFFIFQINMNSLSDILQKIHERIQKLYTHYKFGNIYV